MKLKQKFLVGLIFLNTLILAPLFTWASSESDEKFWEDYGEEWGC